jgi:hypothetical protein
MWRSVIDELTENDAVGEAFPVTCARHPDAMELVSVPGRLPYIAPDGRCFILSFDSLLNVTMKVGACGLATLD